MHSPTPHASRIAAAALFLAAASLADAQALLRGATSPAPDLKVVLTWPEVQGTSRFNVYRRNSGAAAYPATALNAQPLQALTSCPAIQAVIPIGGEEWTMLATSLVNDPNDPLSAPFDPCAVATVTPGSPKGARLQLLARAFWRTAIVIGQGWSDTAVTGGQSYDYQLRGVEAGGTETGVIGNDLTIVAGAPTALPAPAAVHSHAGDRQALLVWGDVPGAAGFVVERATNPAGPFARVNERTFTARFQHDLLGNLLDPGGAFLNGFVDFQHWDASGNPIPHVVQATPVNGPDNGVTYYYRVSSADLLQQPGSPSAPPVSATPSDKTPPLTPTEITVTANEPASRLEVSWVKVDRDADGHVDPAVAGYRVYRYEASDDVAAPNVLVGFVPHVSGGAATMSLADADPNLRSAFGPKTWWYRVECEDVAANISSRSAAAAGSLADITPPAPPKEVEAEGFEDHIQVRWKPNAEIDMGSYHVYRSLCHLGDWVPCPERREPRTPAGAGHDLPDRGGQKKPEDPCSGPFVLIGSMSQVQALALAAARPDGKVMFDDFTVPLGSPLCYAYLIKAVDTSQNRSGSWPIPDLTREEVVCQRLRDLTPPEGAVITGLFARDGAIEVQWIGAPIQDIGAYHVYRADGQAGPYLYVGGYTVPYPPATAVFLPAPYKPIFTGCDTIPVQAIENMTSGTLLDKNVLAKTIYWYKVAGVDQVGNETPLTKVVPVSTFTFTSKHAPAPSIVSVTKVEAPCGLKVAWNPPFSPAAHLGFAVFRSGSQAGTYLQLGNVVQGNEYLDAAVIAGRDYWYRVAFLDVKGRISELSPPVLGQFGP